MDLGLKGKVAMVAAASAGLGYGVARAMAHDGARVSICSRNREAVEATAKRLADESGAEVIATPCDVTRAADIQAWVDKTVARWGQVDALLMNGGGPPTGTFKELTDEQWQAAFELLLLSAVR